MFAVITGASRGIGKALAYEFASHGYDLLLTCEKNIEMLNQVKLDIIKLFGRQVFVKLGLFGDDDIKAFEKESKNGIADNIYMLINNAGKCDYNILNDVTYDRYKELTYANLDYMFLNTQFFSKYMIRNKQGIIINITSMWGLLGASCEAIYSMTKGGIIAFTKALAKEYSGTVDVIAFALGAVDTDMCKIMETNRLTDAELKKGIEEFVKTLDNGRMFTTQEIAKMIYQNASSHSYKSGDIITLNNGLK